MIKGNTTDKPLNPKPGGFTLLEVLIAVAIVVTLAALSALGLSTLREQANVGDTAQQITSALQLARNNTVASLADSNYGVHFESSRYVLFKDSTYNPSAADNEVYNLDDKVEIYDISLIGGSDVVFDRLQGTTANTGTISIRLKSDPTASRTVNILASGLVGLGGTVSPSGSVITDSRHLHFALGWSLRDTSTLSLVFSDPPNPSVQVDVPLADYYNADQSVFDWEDTIDVNGADQFLRIHTHALSSSDTTLSIHRDRRFNNKALSVYFDAQEIVSYTAAGVPTVGAAGGTMIAQ